MSGLTAMLYGKHKGVPIDEVPVDYLQWVLKQEGTRPATKSMCEASIARRGGSRPATVAGTGNGNESSGGIPCPACGAMLHVTLGEALDPDDAVPF